VNAERQISFSLLQSEQIVSLVDGTATANALNGNKYHLFFVCEVCGSSHKSKWERWLHINNTHNDEPSIKVSVKDTERKNFYPCFFFVFYISLYLYVVSVRMGELRENIRNEVIT